MHQAEVVGTGRHVALKMRCLFGRVGSSPAFGTKKSFARVVERQTRELEGLVIERS